MWFSVLFQNILMSHFLWSESSRQENTFLLVSCTNGPLNSYMGLMELRIVAIVPSFGSSDKFYYASPMCQSPGVLSSKSKTVNGMKSPLSW